MDYLRSPDRLITPVTETPLMETPLTSIEYATLNFILAWIRDGHDVILVNRQATKKEDQAYDD